MTSLVQKKFGEAAADYAASTVHAKGESLARLVALVQPKPSWRVLDVATGAGHTALTFAPLVAKVMASDITDQMLAEARKLAAERGLGNVKTARAKAEDLPFPDMSFDLVTCRLAAHHFDKPRAFVAEAYRVLMPGGVLALVDNISPDEASCPSSRRHKRASWRAYNEYEKLQRPEPRSLPRPWRMDRAAWRCGLRHHAQREHRSDDRVRPVDEAHALRCADRDAA